MPSRRLPDTSSTSAATTPIDIDPHVENARAIRAYEKIGFKPVGVRRRYVRGDDGMWHDSLLMDLLPEEMLVPELDG